MRYKNRPDDTFECSTLNTHAMAEVLTGDDSAYFSSVEVFVAKKDVWKCLSQAFRDRDVITDNYNTSFGEQRTDEERQRGWY